MPAIIEAAAVSKRFRQPRRFPGVVGALRTLLTREFTEVVAVAAWQWRFCLRRYQGAGG